MNYRDINLKTMVNTYELCKTNDVLNHSIKLSIVNQFIVYEHDKFNVNKKPRNTTVVVSKKRSFEAASYYNRKKIAVLNFANNRNIGGAPYYANAQEESLCRCSTLLPCLEAYSKEFYDYHKQQFIDGEIDNYGTDDLIYTPNVVVFKTDTLEPQLLKENKWYRVDIITCAAPEMFYGYDEQKFIRVAIKRIKRILDVAINQNVEVLILGAFGCGVFKNPPHIVASIFKELIMEYGFEIVEFAISSRNDTTNYDTFKGIIE